MSETAKIVAQSLAGATAQAIYLTQLQVRSLAGAQLDYLVPGSAGDVPRQRTIPSGASFHDVQILRKYVDRNTLEIGVEDTGVITVDNVTVRQWHGRHFTSEGTTAPAITGQPALNLAAAGMKTFVAPGYSSYAKWVAFFVLKRTSNAFVGVAPVLYFGGAVESTDYALCCGIDALGAIYTYGAAASIAGGVVQGRKTAIGALPLNAREVVAVSSDASAGWAVYLNGVRVDTTNIGANIGIGFNQINTAGAAVACIGATESSSVLAYNAGGPALERVLLYGGASYATDETKLLRVMRTLKNEYAL